MSDIVLYDYWRSSASYRVRITLNLKKIAYATVPVNLLTKEHLSAEHMKRNPQGYVPALVLDGELMTQSLAIIEYLDETRTEIPILPGTPLARQNVRAMADLIAMDIHPICNPNVVNRHLDAMEGDDEERVAWMQHFIGKGLTALEALVEKAGDGDFCFGNWPTLADICLMPQLYNARRWQVDLSGMPRITAVEAKCAGLEAFQNAHPDAVQPPAA